MAAAGGQAHAPESTFPLGMSQAQGSRPFPLIARHSRPVLREITHRWHLDELPAGPAAKGMARD
jgi:hypothetical protein